MCIRDRLYNSPGIYFGAIQGAPDTGTTTGETLRHYEEGTFTPQIWDADSGGNQGTLTTSVGVYTRVGDLVTVKIKIIGVDSTGMTAGNNAYFRGLPFASADDSCNSIGTAHLGLVDFLDAEYNTTIVPANTSFFRIHRNRSNSVTAAYQVSSFDSTSDIRVSFTYRAA